MGDHNTVKVPLIKLGEQLPGVICNFQTICWQLPRVNALFADRRLRHFIVILLYRPVELPVFKIHQRHHKLCRTPYRRLGQLCARRCNSTTGHLVILRIEEHNIFMAVMFAGIRIHLAPLPTQERHHVRVLRVITGNTVTFTNALASFLPAARSNPFCMVVNGPEIKIGAIAGEITGIAWRVKATAPHQGHRHNKRIWRERGVHV